MKLIFIASCLIFANSALAAFEFSPRSPSQVTKEAKRWSLSQWMEQKGKIQWMDLWLHSNVQSPSFYEVYVGGDYGTLETTSTTSLGPLITGGDYNTTSGHAGIFVSFIGVYGRYERNSDENRTTWDALAQLRLLGTSDQASNLTVFYGFRGEEFLNDKVLHQQAGGSLTLYLLNAWAIQGRYQHFFEETSDNSNTISGHRVEATTWLEWGAVRFYGTWYKEPIELSNAVGRLEATREGVNAGLRVYLDFKK